MVPDFGEEDTERKICFIASKGTLDMVYPSLVMANAALMEGVETHIFFTFWGMDIITKKHMDVLPKIFIYLFMTFQTGFVTDIIFFILTAMGVDRQG